MRRRRGRLRLRELRLPCEATRECLGLEQAARLARVWPGLIMRRLSCGMRDGAALRQLAGLHQLEELRVPLLASVSVDHEAGALLGGLAGLPKLAASGSSSTYASDEADGGASALQAAAERAATEGLAALPPLRTLALDISLPSRTPYLPDGALASLAILRAARPSLRFLNVPPPPPPPPRTSFGRSRGACPRLERASLAFDLRSQADPDGLGSEPKKRLELELKPLHLSSISSSGFRNATTSRPAPSSETGYPRALRARGPVSVRINGRNVSTTRRGRL
eukprot:tig00000215_g18533.t1